MIWSFRFILTSKGWLLYLSILWNFSKLKSRVLVKKRVFFDSTFLSNFLKTRFILKINLNLMILVHARRSISCKNNGLYVIPINFLIFEYFDCIKKPNLLFFEPAFTSILFLDSELVLLFIIWPLRNERIQFQNLVLFLQDFDFINFKLLKFEITYSNHLLLMEVCFIYVHWIL